MIKSDDVLDPAREEHLWYGVSACDIYRDLYEHTYRFAQKHPQRACLPTTRSGTGQLFAAAVCGCFPPDDGLGYYKRTYCSLLDAAESAFDSDTLKQILSGECRTPLQIASDHIKVERRAWPDEPVLFLLDNTKLRDLIDYWNLRALGMRVVPVPLHWRDDLLEFCATFVRRQYVSDPSRPRIPHPTVVMGSRSIGMDRVRDIVMKLDLPAKDAIIGGNYPRIWDEWARARGAVLRCSLDAGEREDEVLVEDQRISFRLASPPFEMYEGLPEAPRWANVVQLCHYGVGDEIATVLPDSIPKLDRLLDTMEFKEGRTRVSSEGIVSLGVYSESTVFWRLCDGVSVMQAWMKSRGLDAELSGAGRVCLQIVRQLGGILGVSQIAYTDILHTLNRMARGLVQTDANDSEVKGRKPRTRGRTEARDTWWNLLRKVHGNEREAERQLKRFVDRGVLRVGLKVRCEVCSHRNWYSTHQLADELQCERCLQSFPFPADRPPVQAWAYRTQGPFSTEDYAQGAYSVAITLRFLFVMLHIEGTWSPSLALRDETGRESEIDFAVWYRTRRAQFQQPQLIIGECKSFGELFQPDDIRRAKLLAKRFPEAMLVFATLRSELTDREKRRLSRLARSGRRRTRTGRWSTPVMVLTAVELMGKMGPPSCWKVAGGRFEEFGKTYPWSSDPNQLCEATQRLHLGMELDTETPHR